ncbi:histidine kinase N-terminal 7TM domain-containing diguanylate cyclase [Robertmurraya kyonggiensis]|uniref:Diguanylate cyclase n=1 Tax=Robertmurraya kyonggiensis TaxID=1037680 RepID=A0A4U1D302_9BACI|nr:histidine kinase N-terminal 7TM domain-containing protein [Robertmurraya kyonggiensis]TKC16769.1 diguanylate cyclase [Robertmurraya kyonggiensis]
MNSELTAYITLICTSGVLNLYLCFYVFLKRHNYTKIARFFIFYTSFITIYCFASAFGLMSTTIEEIKFWTIIQYAGMPFSPPLGLLFVMQYLGYKLSIKKYIALLIIPIMSLIMVATNDLHHLHYRIFEVDPILGAPYVHQEIGVWYMIHGVYTFACMFVAFLLVLFSWKDTAKSYRGQLLALLCGQLVPMVTAFIYLIGCTPPGVDPVPMVLWLTSLLYLWAISTSQMFRIMPIAKDSIFNSINDGVIVLDESYRLIEFNRASNGMFPQLEKSMFGMNFLDIWNSLSGEVFPFELESVTNNEELKLIGADRLERIYQVRTSALHHINKSQGLLIIFTDITELKGLQLELEHQAYYDELTQIYNRRAFFQICNEAFADAKSTSSSFTVILMDVDFFKRVNDTYGHYMGDLLLEHVAKVCKSHLKENALFARYGGEEFVLALKGYTASEGEVLSEELRSLLETQPLVTSEGDLSVTLSFGVAEATEGTEETVFKLLNKADKALYSAKQEGRNRVHVYTEREEIFQ